MIIGNAHAMMLVTGRMHCLLGVISSITASFGFLMFPDVRIYCGVAVFVGIWTIFVGCFGISAVRRQYPDRIKRRLQLTYMVTAILSACIFCPIGSWMYTFRETPTIWFTEDNTLNSEVFPTNVRIVEFVGAVTTTLEFILAIVSSSICCCCSPPIENPTVVVQEPFQQIMNLVPITTKVPYESLEDFDVRPPPPPYEPNSNPTKPQ